MRFALRARNRIIEAFELDDLYQESGILTSNFYDDGLHIALATLAEVDLLVSWNFRHIVHYDKIRRFNAVNLEQGYKSLTIYSPREVARYFFENEMLIQLNIMAARVMDRPIPSVYGNEASSLRIVDILRYYPCGLIHSFLHRTYHRYILRDFSIIVPLYLAGFSMFMFGVVFGAYN